MTSFGPEVPLDRRDVFRRCSLVETSISYEKREWLVLEETLKP